MSWLKIKIIYEFMNQSIKCMHFHFWWYFKDKKKNIYCVYYYNSNHFCIYNYMFFQMYRILSGTTICIYSQIDIHFIYKLKLVSYKFHCLARILIHIYHNLLDLNIVNNLKYMKYIIFSLYSRKFVLDTFINMILNANIYLLDKFLSELVSYMSNHMNLELNLNHTMERNILYNNKNL